MGSQGARSGLDSEGRSRRPDGEDRSSARRKRDLNRTLFCYCSRNGGDEEWHGRQALASVVLPRSRCTYWSRPGPDLRPRSEAPISGTGPRRVHGPSCGDPGVRHTGHIDGLHNDGHLGPGWFCGRPSDPSCAQGGAWRDRQFALPARQHLPGSDPFARPQSWRCWSELSRREAICAINHHEATPQAA